MCKQTLLLLVMAMGSGYKVDSAVDFIDPMYLKAAIYEINKKTEVLYCRLSMHVHHLNDFIDNDRRSLDSDQPKETIKQTFAIRHTF